MIINSNRYREKSSAIHTFTCKIVSKSVPIYLKVAVYGLGFPN